MSAIAWNILTILLMHAQMHANGTPLLDDGTRALTRGYMAGWTLGEKLGGDAATIQGARVKHHPENEHERALQELISMGLVEEMQELPERFRLIVK